MEAVIWKGKKKVSYLIVNIDRCRSWGGNTYSSLHVRVWVVEVFEVLVAIDPSGHGRDIEAEKGAANGAEGG
jgi:hypothetical protein